MSASCETSPGYAEQPIGQRDLPPVLWTDYSNYKVSLIVVVVLNTSDDIYIDLSYLR